MIAALAAFTQALSGFGFALAAMPPMSVLIGPKAAVITVTALSLAFTVGSSLGQRRHVEWRLASAVSIAALAGMPVGWLILTALEERTLRIVIACVVLAFIPLIGRGVTTRRPGMLSVAAGVTSGGLLTSTGLNGPPLVAAFQAIDLPPRRFRATLQAVFCTQDFLAVTGFLLVGRAYLDSPLILLAGVPGLVLGWWAGDRAFGRLDPARFRSVVLVVLVASAGVSLGHAILQ